MTNIPNDPIMLLSYMNTKLRDEYNNLDTLCYELEINKDELITRLASIGYTYHAKQNRFI